MRPIHTSAPLSFFIFFYFKFVDHLLSGSFRLVVLSPTTTCEFSPLFSKKFNAHISPKCRSTGTVSHLPTETFCCDNIRVQI